MSRYPTGPDYLWGWKEIAGAINSTASYVRKHAARDREGRIPVRWVGTSGERPRPCITVAELIAWMESRRALE